MTSLMVFLQAGINGLHSLNDIKSPLAGHRPPGKFGSIFAFGNDVSPFWASMVVIAVCEHGRFVRKRALACPQRHIMLLQVAQSRQDVVGGAEDNRQTKPRRRVESGQPPNPPAEPSQLQSIHAGKRGITLKGTNHETFWEWCA